MRVAGVGPGAQLSGAVAGEPLHFLADSTGGASSHWHLFQ
jgi:hypothetical protein